MRLQVRYPSGSQAAVGVFQRNILNYDEKEKKMRLVYSYYVLDIVHKGHLLMMRNSKAIAGEDGKLIVGILTDEAVMEKKPRPILPFEDRMELASAIKYVDLVVAQETYSPLPNVMRIKPDILMESTSHDEEAIEKAKEIMESIGGRVIVIPYFPSKSSTRIKNEIKQRR
jgi:phosphoenolpyruvate phosphomutase